MRDIAAWFVTLEVISCAGSFWKMDYLSNRPQVSMVYRHVGRTWEEFVNHKPGACDYEFFECSSNIPSGLSYV